jgi:acetyl esterase/lipase
MRLPVLLRPLMLAAMIIPCADAAEPVPTKEPGGDTVELWPGGVPGADKVTVKEELLERLPAGPMRDRVVQHTTRPLLTFFPPRGKPNGVWLLIVPGGGYQRVVIDKEGFEAAEWFTRRGFGAAVLRYRLPADGWAAGADAPVNDAQRAMRLMRERAPKTARIGAIGYSAGGHLVARLLTEPGLDYPHRDAIDERPSLPDFGVLMYPVILVTGAEAHPGSAQQLVLAGVAPTDLARYSPDTNVSAATPPTILIHAADDTTVPVANSLRMYEALRRAGVRSELHVFDRGGHGFGLRSIEGKDVAAWPSLVEAFALTESRD